jgi:hypothetical protein
MFSPGTAATNCENWSSTTSTGLAGIFARAQGQFWARGGPDTCTTMALLYCVEP